MPALDFYFQSGKPPTQAAQLWPYEMHKQQPHLVFALLAGRAASAAATLVDELHRRAGWPSQCTTDWKAPHAKPLAELPCLPGGGSGSGGSGGDGSGGGGGVMRNHGKAPLVPPGTPVVNALFTQREAIVNFLRACIGLPAENHMAFDHRTKTSAHRS